jgi:hypothetical protein
MALSLLYLGLATAGVCLLMFGLFRYFEKREAAADPPRSPLADERQNLPPAPRLQLAPSREGQLTPDLDEHPLEELKTVRAEEDERIKNYGWVDEKNGVVRLPINRAKELLIERGSLAVRAASDETNKEPSAAAGPAKQSEAQKPSDKTATEKSPEKHQ